MVLTTFFFENEMNLSQSLIFRQIVLDFDGVITGGTNRAYIDAYKEAVVSVGVQLPDGEVEAAILRHWGESPRRELAGVLGSDHPRLDAALDHYMRHIDTGLLASAHPIPGALETVERLEKSCILYLISGMGLAPLHQIVSKFGLQRCFRTVISTSDSDLPERQKASGYHLGELCRRDGLAANETLCVGDAKSDIEMARCHGIPVAIVLTGALDRESAQAQGVEWIIPSLAELPDFLRQSELACHNEKQ
jgi:phosphoglycolate phosphatase-like HAD superfamily hydrolase